MKTDNHSKELLKATSIIGSSKIFTILLGVIQTKIVSILLGPLGVGILGLYKSNIELVRSITGFGLSFSAVKMIAGADQNEKIISEKIIVLKRWVIFTGLLGVSVMIIFSKQLSIYAFGDESKKIPIIVSSIAILFMSISDGQLALLQGKRLIKEMAKLSIAFSIFNIIISVPIYYYFKEKGIILVLVLTPFFSMAIAWLKIRKIKIKKIKLSFLETYLSGKQMIKLGFFIVINGFLSNFTMYLIRIEIGQKIDLISVGLVQAGWTLSNMYVGIILNAMLADFFPRLSKLGNDNEKTNQLINQQLKIALILGTPFVIFMLVFSKFIIKSLYSEEFLMANSLVELLFLNVFLTLIVWPLGVLFLARDKGMVCIITDFIWNMITILLVNFGILKWKLEIVGIAFCIATIIKILITLKVVNRISEYRISKDNKLIIAVYGVVIILLFLNNKMFNNSGFNFSNIFLILFSGVFSLFELNKILDINQTIKRLKKKIINR